MKKLQLLLFLIFATVLTNAQDYETWGTFKVSGTINNKWVAEAESEARYNFDDGQVRYFHYDFGALYKISEYFNVGLFYRSLYESKDGVESKISLPHGDVRFKYSNFNLRTRLEYINKYGNYEDKFRLRIRPGYQMDIWRNFNPFIQNEIFLTEIDYLTRNRFNVGVSINVGKFVIQPGYMLESNHKDLWTNRNILWVNTKMKI